jgi:2-oxo-4-hydroxy-4-carboxy--5-ureidoimidazoline (OHCU) decarboxylase
MHHLPRKLSTADLARVFEGRTRLVDRLARRENPLADPQALLHDVPEEELTEALNAHPRIGARNLSAVSAREQGGEDDPAVLDELARLNQTYEEKFGFRFVIFVNRRPKAEILRALQERLLRSRREELRTGVQELVAIAQDRYRVMTGGRLPSE